MEADPLRFAAGQAIPGTGFWRGVVRRARKLRIRAIPPLFARPSGGRTLLTFKPTQRFDGIITSKVSAGIYGVTEARFSKAGGVWVALDGGRFVFASEYNFAAGLASGTAVEVWYTAGDDWRFINNKAGIIPSPAGGCTPIPVYTICPDFRYCTSPPTVTFAHNGVTLGTCTPVSGVAGNCCSLAIDLPPGERLTVTIGADRYDTQTFTLNTTCLSQTVTQPPCAPNLVANLPGGRLGHSYHFEWTFGGFALVPVDYAGSGGSGTFQASDFPRDPSKPGRGCPGDVLTGALYEDGVLIATASATFTFCANFATTVGITL